MSTFNVGCCQVICNSIPGINIVPSCWSVFSEDRRTKVIVAKERDIYLLDLNEHHVIQHNTEFSHHFLSILALAVSPCKKHIALLTDAGNPFSNPHLNLNSNLLFK